VAEEPVKTVFFDAPQRIPERGRIDAPDPGGLRKRDAFLVRRQREEDAP
jgi:hypothetical protein